MRDHVEQLLDGLDAGAPAGEPPPAFLRAVGVRRRRRRMGRVAVLAGVIAVAGGVWVGMNAWRPGPHRPEAEVAGIDPPAISLVALHRANRDMDVDALELPAAGWDAGSRPVLGGDPGQIEAWLSR